MSMYVTPYKQGSRSAKLLAAKLGCLLLRKEGSKFAGSKKKLIVNWGDSNPNKEILNSSVLNPPDLVNTCSNKLKFFEILGHTEVCPEWTTSPAEAEEWLDEGSQVVCRTLLQAHSGRGIVFLDSPDMEVPAAPLYTKYVPKKSEYRVHVFMGKAFDVQRKARSMDVPDDQVNWKIRNHEGGFIYARYDGLGDVPEKVLTNAELCASMVGLDFGAVDVIYNERRDAAYVLEINTAPGLEGSTAFSYAEKLSEFHEIFKEVVREGGTENTYITRAKNKVLEHANQKLWQVNHVDGQEIIRQFQEHIRNLEGNRRRINPFYDDVFPGPGLGA